MLREHRPDAVIVTSPDATHAGYMVRALDAGYDVITEKPMTTDAAKRSQFSTRSRAAAKKCASRSIIATPRSAAR